MGIYIRLVDYDNYLEKEDGFYVKENKYIVSQEKFKGINGVPFAYWVSERIFDIFKTLPLLQNFGEAKEGMHTGDTNTYIKKWYEINYELFSDRELSEEDIDNHNKKWVLYNKGGEYRKWYGNREHVLAYDKKSREDMMKLKGHVRPSQHLYFKKGMTWSLISSNKFAVRCFEEGMLFDVSSHSFFCNEDSYLFFAGFLNSKIANQFLVLLNPTINFSSGIIKRLPICVEADVKRKNTIDQIVAQCINIGKDDWDSFEISTEYSKHVMIEKDDVKMGKLISDKYKTWKDICDNRFFRMKQNEEKLNDIFIHLYGLEKEMNSEVEEASITIRKADLLREIKSLISYAVGCILGRYSLKEDGVIFAGGEWDGSKYSDDFAPCEYGIIPITENQYFGEDLCTRVIDFIKVVYGEDTLNENLKFIANALKPDSYEAPKKIIRDYLFNGFFDNHYQIYQHRPIYWQLDSGKAGGFRAIMYMHRFNENTLSTVRTEYIQELRYKYEDELQRLQHKLGDAKTTAEKNEVKKQATAIDKKLVECTVYDDLLNHVTGSIQNYVFDLDDGVKTNYAKFLSIDGDKTKNVLTVIKL